MLKDAKLLNTVVTGHDMNKHLDTIIPELSKFDSTVLTCYWFPVNCTRKGVVRTMRPPSSFLRYLSRGTRRVWVNEGGDLSERLFRAPRVGNDPGLQRVISR